MKALLVFLTVLGSITLTVAGLVGGNLAIAGVGIALPFLVLLLLFPLLRRLAARNASRRPKETLLILLGALLGTAIVTSSGVVGDTFAASVNDTVYRQLGPVDEVVSLSKETSNTVKDYLDEHPNANIDGVITIVRAPGTIGIEGNDPRALSDAQVIEMPLEQAKAFGGSPNDTGIDGATPQPGHAVITTDTAEALRANIGSFIDIYLLGAKRTLIVDRILETKGLSGLSVNDATGHSYNVFVAPNTLATIDSEGVTQGALYETLISNTGNIRDGVKLSNTVASELAPIAQVDQVKKDRIKDAKNAGKDFRRLFLGIGSFTIIAGILLLINIFTMLAQERQNELGMLRAMGLKRRGLIAAFSIEGFLYALGSCALGVLVGIGVGRVVVYVASNIFSSPRVGFHLVFTSTPESMLRGFVGGLGISMLTVVLASMFIARMNVIRAIRELPDPGIARKRLLGLIIGIMLLGIGVAMTLGGINTKNEFFTLIGPDVIALGAIMFFRRWLPTKTVVTVASILVILWTIFAFTLMKSVFKNANGAVYVIQGIQLTAFAVALITANQDRIGSLIRIIGRGSATSMSLRLGLAYPLARRGRTALLLAMYSLVVFVLTFIMTISHVLSSTVEREILAESRGADIALVATDNPYGANPSKRPNVPVDSIAANAGVEQIAPLSSGFVEINKVGQNEGAGLTANGFDQRLVGNGAPTLMKRLNTYATDDDAFRTVANSNDLVILQGERFATRDDIKAIHPGDKVEIRASLPEDPEGKIEPALVNQADKQNLARQPSHIFTVAAISEGRFEALMSDAALATVVPASNIQHSDAYVKVKGGVNAKLLAAQLSGLYVADNIQAFTIREDIQEEFSVAKQFLLLIEGYMAIGLLVGIAGLGVVMVRAVRERRRQIGMLRAMGFQSRSIRNAFIAEAAFIAGEGIVLGVVLALVVLSRIFSTVPEGVPIKFDVPWFQLVILTGATFVASLLATAAPAQQASRIPPAVALRVTD